MGQESQERLQRGDEGGHINKDLGTENHKACSGESEMSDVARILKKVGSQMGVWVKWSGTSGLRDA